MAGSSLLTLLDDIATLLGDISVMGKLAAKKTAGVLGDDLSLNAQQVTGVRANRELPVVWSVARIINQQGYSGAVGAADKRIYPVGHHAFINVRRRVSLL